MNTIVTEDRETLTTQFKVIIPNTHDMTFKSCDGIESEIEVGYLHEGGVLSPPRTVRSSHRVNKISFSRGIAPSQKGKSQEDTILKWYLDVCDSSKPLEKKTISIKVINNKDEKVSEWRLINAWPCRWVGPVLTTDYTQFTVEYVTFAHEGIEVK